MAFYSTQRGGRSGTADLSHAGVVDEDVEPAVVGEDFMNQHLSARVIPQVCGESKDIGALCGEFAGTLFDSFCRGSDCDS